MPAHASETGSISVIVLDMFAERGAKVARQMRGVLGCAVKAAPPLHAIQRSCARATVVAVLIDAAWWKDRPRRLGEQIDQLGGAPCVVCVPKDDLDLAVAAIAMGAAEIVQTRCAGEPGPLCAAVRMAAARAMRTRRDARRRAAIAGALTRTRRTNLRLQSLVGFLRSAALTDALTGLANRRALDSRLTEAVRTAARHGTELAALVIDVDNLKAVNDALGHEAGDEILKAVASVLKSELRAGDVAARVGGDEFVVLLPHTPARSAELLRERMRRAFERAAAPFRLRPGVSRAVAGLGLSIGIASRAGAEGPDDGRGLLRRADESLYVAKRSRKARLEVTVGRKKSQAARAA